MTVEMGAETAKAICPKILNPDHFGNYDLSMLKTLLQDSPGIELRIRDLP